ncbi:DUF4290 domain-containing protein [Pontibacter sp. BT310]|jgi:hypothetical protein|uniref:DUF4290 domain-containing protein n=1 Tax=Pontibacter populi TaxID=890055 RepID=A0ABS6XBG8_9BACT|nr:MULTISPECIES: DUF4290 domain-containing protein [Pontibacter]MBJ6118508.1 DUF4290 domain-containing protein [Pontibacter sp. BT310]MBR0570937.1 DUF4290 domain-containing protein [Microvirga sp. STS03]MBW3365362.1 DUF4290 domain-containing protein [Pontibacter populi]
MEASTSFKQDLLLREYGRNVQDLVNHILTIEDRAERTRLSQLLINLMAKLNPQLRDTQDYQQKLWNHLYVMSGSQLDVDAPYPLSAMEYLNDKPQRMHYPLETPKFKHYGQNVELLIQRATELEDEKEREAAIISIGKLMKTLYRSYNKESITDDVILSDIRQLSKGKLNMDLAYIESNNLFESNIGGGSRQQDNQQRSQQQNRGGDNRGGDRNRNKNPRSSNQRNK